MSAQSTKGDLEILEKVQETGVDLRNRRIYLCADIDQSQAYRVITALLALDGTDGAIQVLLNSPGGTTYDALAIYDALMGARNKIQILGLGQVMSAATILLQAGDERILAPYCRFMVHHGSWNLGEAHASVVVAAGKEQEATNKTYVEILAVSSGQDPTKIYEMCDRETYLSAVEAVELGFADRVLKHEVVRSRAPLKRKKEGKR